MIYYPLTLFTYGRLDEAPIVNQSFLLWFGEGCIWSNEIFSLSAWCKKIGFCIDIDIRQLVWLLIFTSKTTQSMDSSFSFSALHSCFSGTGLPSHRTADHISSVFFKMVNIIKEVSPDHVSFSLWPVFSFIETYYFELHIQVQAFPLYCHSYGWTLLSYSTNPETFSSSIHSPCNKICCHIMDVPHLLKSEDWSWRCEVVLNAVLKTLSTCATV